MDDLDRFFPVVPQNVPADDLSDYLRMYANEAGAFARSQQPITVSRIESTVNTRMPVMRTLQGFSFGTVGQPLGVDPNSLVDSSGNPIVSAVWIQRALNAAGIRTNVDGIVGGQTMTNLLTVWRNLTASTAPQPTKQVTGSLTSPGTVKIPRALQDVLAAYPQVVDPPPLPVTPPASSPPSPQTQPQVSYPSTQGSQFTGILGVAVVGAVVLAIMNRNSSGSTSSARRLPVPSYRKSERRSARSRR